MSETQTLTAAADAAVAAAGNIIPFAPPFYPPWQKLTIPGTTPAGFWRAIAHDPTDGGIVMQLGTAAHPPTQPPTSTTLQVGWQWLGELAAGWNSITARFQSGPVSLRQNGGTISAKVFMNLRSLGPQLPDVPEIFVDEEPATSNGILYLRINAYLRGGSYRLRLGGELRSQYQGAATPYGEIICHRIEVVHSSPAFQAAAQARPDLVEEEAEVQDVDPNEAAKDRLLR